MCLLTGGLVRTWGGRVQSLDWWREQDIELPCQVRAVRDSRAVISAPWSTPRLPPSRPTLGQLCHVTAAPGCWSQPGAPGPVNTRVHICVQTGVHLSWVDSCTGPSPTVESGALSASVARAPRCSGSSLCGVRAVGRWGSSSRGQWPQHACFWAPERRLMGLVAPHFAGSSWIRDGTRVPCVGGRSLYP